MKTTTISRFVALLILLLAGQRVADAQIVTVALSGDTAPGTSDTFSSFDRTSLVLNDAGQTAFKGNLNSSSTTNAGIWSEGGGSGLSLVARRGIGTAPGTSDTFVKFFAPALNDAGQTAFFGGLSSSGATNGGIWSEGGGSGLALVAREGNIAPGTSDTFAFLNLRLVLNDAGQTAFSGSLNNSSSSATDRGIWSEGGGSGLALVAREGNVAPGISETFTKLFSPLINDAGQTAFEGRLNSGGATNRGIWSEGGGSGLMLVARSGSVAPGTSDNFVNFFAPVLNDAGQTAYRGGLNSSFETNEGIWSEGGGSGLALVAREGNVAPGTSDTFSNLFDPVLNGAGQTAFWGRLDSSGATDTGIWTEREGSGLALVAREGNVAPGTSDTFADFKSPVLNDAGQTAFLGSPNSGGLGIWAEDRAGVLTLITREGDLLDVDDGPGTDFRTISSLRFHSHMFKGDAPGNSFNNLGQLAFWAEFTDGTSGIFVSNLVAVPEPSTLLLGALACMGMLMRRNR